MAWKIEFAPRVEKELKRIGKSEAKRILDYLVERVASSKDPRQLGKPLKGNLTEYWRYRVGDYRVVCEIQDTKMVVLVVRVGHRKEVYD